MTVAVRKMNMASWGVDIYRVKFEVLAYLGWVLSYIGAVCVFYHTHGPRMGEGRR